MGIKQEECRDPGRVPLIGLHPCIDWELINYGTDPEAIRKEKEKQSRYDELMAEYLEREILQKGLKSLVYAGIAHCTAKFTEYRMGTEPPEPLLRMGNLVYRSDSCKGLDFQRRGVPLLLEASCQ